MSQRNEVVVLTRDGSCPCVMSTPEGPGAWPAVIMFMDAGGVRPAMVEMSDRLADMGYVTLLPEMYYRHGPYDPFSLETAFTDPGERSRIMAMAGSLTQEMVVGDVEALLDFLVGRPEVAGSKVGTTGYCMGGRLSLIAAGSHPERIAAAASFHGGRLATEEQDSPHRIVGRITGRVYVAAAENDGSFPPEQAALLEKALTD
ncbi:MAG TPA: dienelactone hydrolase family protein, partial [Acidimicrobiales bacterium]|nr:dienelactone hydrolase family protein [Acidimicrobiales bacterium]